VIALPTKMKIHIIGIGGIGMSAIAEILLDLGCAVSGSDINENANTKKLQSRGAIIFIGHQKSNIKEDLDLLVHSTAILKDNVEIISASEMSIPCYRRSEILSDIMRLKNGIAIAGTHGKTTTTSVVSTIFSECGEDPSFIIGGIVANLNGHARVGKGPWVIAEADESDGTFLQLSPILAAITNVDFDHLDYYGTKDALIDAFKTFCHKIPFYGLLSLNVNDKYLVEISKDLKKPVSWYGIRNSKEQLIDVEAKNIISVGFGTTFDLYYKNEFKVQVSTSLFGKHNVENILAAISTAIGAGIPIKKAAQAINAFSGVGRRMQRLFESDDFNVIDDYAHHPTELEATISALREMSEEGKLVGVFEPHRFSRTKDCWKEFLHCFNKLDKLYLLPVYPASEQAIPGIDSIRLAEDINSLHPGLANCVESLDEIQELISKSGADILVSMGAGSIGRKIRENLGV
jgi:UDP-N-acetylmuramate--alanine ligase